MPPLPIERTSIMIALILSKFECNILLIIFMLNTRKSSEDDDGFKDGFDGFDGSPILATRLFLGNIVVLLYLEND